MWVYVFNSYPLSYIHIRSYQHVPVWWRQNQVKMAFQVLLRKWHSPMVWGQNRQLTFFRVRKPDHPDDPRNSVTGLSRMEPKQPTQSTHSYQPGCWGEAISRFRVQGMFYGVPWALHLICPRHRPPGQWFQGRRWLIYAQQDPRLIPI